MKRVVWTEPLRTDVRCRHCHKPLEAYGEVVYKSRRVYREFLWRHHGGATTCVTTNRAEPSEFGYVPAARKVEAALAGREASAAALREALKPTGRL